jgi:hypothetical protein
MFGVNDDPPDSHLRGVTLHVPTLPSGHRPAKPKLQARLRNLAWRLRHDPASALTSLRQRLARFHPRKEQPDQVSVARFVADSYGTAPDTRVALSGAGPYIASHYGPAALAAVIRQVQPDLIHSLEFQHNAYRVLAARELLGAAYRSRWLASNWGSDIYLFGREVEHAPLIRQVLSTADFYSCECTRDLALGRSFGYRGPDLPVLPNAGAMDMTRVAALHNPTPPSQRRQIMVKGYDHFAGRAMTSLAVLERLHERLRGYTIMLYSVGARPRARAQALKASGMLDIRLINHAPHDEMMRQFGRSRLYLGVSISDGISTSVLEAMAMGAFPIQTNTSCCGEWFEDGVSGFAIAPDDVDAICRCVTRALDDDALVDQAARLNLATVRTRLAKEVMVPKIRGLYDQVLGSSRHSG